MEIELPSEYPTPNELYDQMMDAIRESILNNVVVPLEDVVEDSLGPDLRDVFEDSLLFKPTVDLQEPLSTLTGNIPIQQIVGRVLRTDDVMQTWSGETPCLVNASSMRNTKVRPYGNSLVSVTLDLPNTPLLYRYLRFAKIPFGRIDAGGSNLIRVNWDIRYEGADNALADTIARMGWLLPIYYKLQMRFNPWICSVDFPTFQS